ncbi:XRE family transcriptional regulator [Bacillus sp. HMF5848]|uniref:helix-turn-helix domain-containing protein n=1 Tax=Bacillus sp. HMF5848 TaxID=2495421 RepID=UPI000F766B4E|nr:helix-turn-helix transcriptional regulator [Bacillus sp. HMF5848]RSK25513.1 XRE family transcriptional regulator [Bacillus sp. HMF5848]
MEGNQWGRSIRAYRKLKGYTQETFANELGISVSVLGEVERGTREPDEQLLQQVAKTLNIQLEDLDLSNK